jgi:hypothetical protein
VTRLRQMMLDELQRRNYSQSTVRSYIFAVEDLQTISIVPPTALGQSIFVSTRRTCSVIASCRRERSRDVLLLCVFSL